ncbi:MAG TPA: hypothetical protein VMA95_05705 [Streptosporangiaceae bacterium]|nr:hypothetical protein [Streptosporangiaceae bacterium]
METIIGFAAGYLVGAKEGREGIDRLKTSIEAIVKSPETRRMAGEAMSLAGLVMRQASARGIGAGAGGIAELVVRRLTQTREA